MKPYLLKLPHNRHAVARRNLRIPPNNRLEVLKASKKDYYSIRIKEHWRIVFNWSNGNCSEVKIIDYH